MAELVRRKVVRTVWVQTKISNVWWKSGVHCVVPHGFLRLGRHERKRSGRCEREWGEARWEGPLRLLRLCHTCEHLKLVALTRHCAEIKVRIWRGRKRGRVSWGKGQWKWRDNRLAGAHPRDSRSQRMSESSRRVLE